MPVDIPPAPGAPVPQGGTNALGTTSDPFLSSDAPGVASAATGPQWGIFTTTGAPVVTADTVKGFQYQRDWKVSDYKQEQGAFTSYNKVQTPYIAKMQFVRGGPLAQRTAILAQIGGIVASLTLYSVVTPEFTYPNANATHYDYARTSVDGVTMLTIDVWFEEIRQTAETSFSNTTQAPSGSPQQSGGTVQPQTPTNPPPVSAFSGGG